MDRAAKDAQLAIYRRMTVEAKLRASQALRDFAWELKRAAIQRQHPELSEEKVLERVRASFLDVSA